MDFEKMIKRTEFGLQVPEDATMVYGARAILRNNEIDIPFDRQGVWFDKSVDDDKRNEFLKSLNPIMDKVVNDYIKHYNYVNSFVTDDLIYCRFNEGMCRNSGYLYISIYK